jgi:hypothetical protein
MVLSNYQNKYSQKFFKGCASKIGAFEVWTGREIPRLQTREISWIDWNGGMVFAWQQGWIRSTMTQQFQQEVSPIGFGIRTSEERF